MTEAERQESRSILEAKHTALSGSLCSREEIAIEKAPDTLDAIQLAGERETAIRNLDRAHEYATANRSVARTNRRWFLWDLPALRGRDFAKAASGAAVGSLLHYLSGEGGCPGDSGLRYLESIYDRSLTGPYKFCVTFRNPRGRSASSPFAPASAAANNCAGIM